MPLPTRSKLRIVCLASAVFLPVFVGACGEDDPVVQGGAGQGGNAPGGAGGEEQGGAGQGGSTEGGTGGVGGATIGSVDSDYCTPVAMYLCKQAKSCGCGAVTPSGNLDEAGCIEAYRKKCNHAYAQAIDAVAAGLARVDPNKAATCVQQIIEMTPACERPSGAVSQGLCSAWISSDEPLGEPCKFPVCAGGEGFCSQGKCKARPGKGEPCDGYECTPGLLCLGGVCSSPKVESDTCVDNAECAPPMHCIAGVCKKLRGAGENCADSSECAVGFRCNSGSCEAVPSSSSCVDTACGNLTTCILLPKCKVKALAGEGCASSKECGDGLWCNAEKGKCEALPGNGQPCAEGVLCAAGLGCQMDSGSCAPLPKKGEPCALGEQGPVLCMDGLGCLEGVCGTLPGLNQACTVDDRCEGALACDFTVNGSFCVPKKGVGGDCENDQVCQSGLHCDYTQNHCVEDLETGTSCFLGNECGPEHGCQPNDALSISCAPLPKAGEVCAQECQAGLACAQDSTAGACISPICAEF